jgi:hypothetical protein
MTSIPVHCDKSLHEEEEVDKRDNDEVIEPNEVLNIVSVPDRAKELFDNCPPSIKREIMNRLTKKKILMYDSDMQTPEALEVITRVKEAYDRKKQRSCNDLKNKRLAKQLNSEQPDGGAKPPDRSELQNEGNAQGREEEQQENYDSAEVLQPARDLSQSAEVLEPPPIISKEPKKQIRKPPMITKETRKKEVVEHQEPQTPRLPPPSLQHSSEVMKESNSGLFKSQVFANKSVDVPGVKQVSTKLFMR